MKRSSTEDEGGHASEASSRRVGRPSWSELRAIGLAWLIIDPLCYFWAWWVGKILWLWFSEPTERGRRCGGTEGQCVTCRPLRSCLAPAQKGDLFLSEIEIFGSSAHVHVQREHKNIVNHISAVVTQDIQSEGNSVLLRGRTVHFATESL